MTNKKINICVIGGGKGSYGMLSALRDNDDYNLTSIISMSDSGGSTGVLRDELDILPPGDIRRAVMALSREHELVKQLFDYRYDKGCSVNGHVVGNLLIAAMADIAGNFEKGLKQICKMFRVKGKVLPVTLEKSELCVEFDDGKIIHSETNIDEGGHDGRIIKAWLMPQVKTNPKVIEALEKADYIIISYGDLYTSIVPNLLTKGLKQAIKKSKAKVIYFSNLMTKKGETTDFELIDFIDVVESYIGEGEIDYVVVNDGYINEKIAEKYKSLEHKSPVKLKDKEKFKNKKYKIIEADLLHESEFVRHSYDKVGKVVTKIIKKDA